MRVLSLLVMAIILNGCMTVYSYNYGDGPVCIQLDKAISPSTLPVDLKARDVTVPVK